MKFESDRIALPFRDMPWQWGDIVIGLGVEIALMGFSFAISSKTSPSRLWIPITLFSTVWMLVYPLARQKGALPRFPHPRTALHELACAVFAFQGVLMALAAMQGISHPDGSASSKDDFFIAILRSGDLLQILILLALSMIVGPIAEEVFFRGMLYNMLRDRMYWPLAALLQGLIFGLFHQGTLLERLDPGVIGVCLAALYEWRKVLVAPILLHILWNAVWTLRMVRELATPQ